MTIDLIRNLHCFLTSLGLVLPRFLSPEKMKIWVDLVVAGLYLNAELNYENTLWYTAIRRPPCGELFWNDEAVDRASGSRRRVLLHRGLSFHDLALRCEFEA